MGMLRACVAPIPVDVRAEQHCHVERDDGYHDLIPRSLRPGLQTLLYSGSMYWSKRTEGTTSWRRREAETTGC
jgi:hypothetical protein